ncbi:MAG: 6-phosphogluconolactonase [Arenicella sp.]
MKWYSFETAQVQANSLAKQVEQDLIRLLQEKDLVTLCVPGGSTPALFLQLLSKTSLDWSRVRVVVNDERWVPLNDPLSNEAMLRKLLLNNESVVTQIVSLFDHNLPIEQAIEAFNRRASDVLPLDICVLGMGEDGHTASLFPDMNNLEQALDLSNPAALVLARVPHKTELRVSFNLSALLSARQHYILIKGQAKRQTIEIAEQHKSFQFPISHLLAESSTHIYYTD